MHDHDDSISVIVIGIIILVIVVFILGHLPNYLQYILFPIIGIVTMIIILKFGYPPDVTQISTSKKTIDTISDDIKASEHHAPSVSNLKKAQELTSNTYGKISTYKVGNNTPTSSTKKKLSEMLNNCEKLSWVADYIPELKEWAANKSWPEIYRTCNKGEWLLLLYQQANTKDLQMLTLAKGHCANTVRHLMKDDRSITAVDAAIAYGEGNMSKEQLAVAAHDAYDAVRFAEYPAGSSYRAAEVAEIAATINSSARATAHYTACAVGADTTELNIHAAIKANKMLTADIVRKYIPIDKWNITD